MKVVLIFSVVLMMALFGVAMAQQETYDGFFGLVGQSGGGASSGRANTGPIQFPASPVSRETSGVIVGASGYGFVPPGTQRGGPNYGGGRVAGPSFGGFF